MENIRGTEQPGGIRELLADLKQEIRTGQQKQETEEKKKTWKYPWKWRSKMQASQKSVDTILVIFLNIRGEMEQPVILPLYSGNMVIIRNKPYEVDPRAFWTMRHGFKQYKVLLIREIDRRPISNLDYDEIKQRGDATDSDEFLIKAAIRAQTAHLPPGVAKWGLIIGIIIIVAIVAFFLFGK